MTAPVFAFAQSSNANNGNKNKIKNEIKKESVSSDSKPATCTKAWGHLIAAGWIKKNGSLPLPENCIIPFGISKIFSGKNGNGTTTDTVAPVISDLTITATQTGATIKWNTNELSNSVVYISTSTPVGTTTPATTNNSLVKSHTITVSDLASSTIYYAVITSKDSSGNIGKSSTISFTTLAPAPDTTAPIISGIIATVASTTVNGWWTTNEPATTRMYYSTTSPINVLTSPFIENTTLVTSHNITIPNLATSTLYYLILESKDASGNTQRTDQFSVRTTSGF